jgi:hypothetical protein
MTICKLNAYKYYSIISIFSYFIFIIFIFIVQISEIRCFFDEILHVNKISKAALLENCNKIKMLAIDVFIFRELPSYV